MATIQERVKLLTRKTKAELIDLIVDDEPEVEQPELVVADEPEVVEDETATGGDDVALVTTKGDPTAALKEAVRIDPYPVDADEPDGAQYEYRVGSGDDTEDFTESEFYRLYSPLTHSDAKKLKQVN